MSFDFIVVPMCEGPKASAAPLPHLTPSSAAPCRRRTLERDLLDPRPIHKLKLPSGFAYRLKQRSDVVRPLTSGHSVGDPHKSMAQAYTWGHEYRFAISVYSQRISSSIGGRWGTNGRTIGARALLGRANKCSLLSECSQLKLHPAKLINETLVRVRHGATAADRCERFVETDMHRRHQRRAVSVARS